MTTKRVATAATDAQMVYPAWETSSRRSVEGAAANYRAHDGVEYRGGGTQILGAYRRRHQVAYNANSGYGNTRRRAYLERSSGYEHGSPAPVCEG